MSCDYYRWKGWEWISRYSRNHAIPYVRELADDFAREVAKELAKEVVRRLSDSARTRLRRKKKKDPVSYALEIVYLDAKRRAVARRGRYTSRERESYAWKTKALIRWMYEKGMPTEANPVHGSSLPRISSQVGYAAVYDKLVELGVIQDSPFTEIYQLIESHSGIPSAVKEDLLSKLKEIDVTYGKDTNVQLAKELRLLRIENENMTQQVIRALEEISSVASWTQEAKIRIKKVEELLSGRANTAFTRPASGGK